MKIKINGGLHNIGINRSGDQPNPAIASVSVIGMNWATNTKLVSVSLSLLNKGSNTAKNIKAKLSAGKDYIEVIGSESEFGNIGINETVTCKRYFSFYVMKDSVEIAKFKLNIRDGENGEWTEFFEIPLKMDLPEFKDFVIADGKNFNVAKAGILTENVFLGRGNGDGIANPGESIVILVKDKDKYRRTDLYTSDDFVNQNNINMRATDFWDQFGGIGSSPKYSVPLISSNCPADHQIAFFVEYWVPENKFHIIKRAPLRISVSGRDKTPPGVSWVYISGNNKLQVKTFDGGGIVSVKAKLIPVNEVKGLDDVSLENPGKIIEFELNDEGKEGDMAKSDRVFSINLSPPATYFYRVDVVAIDQYGNKTDYKGSDLFLVHAD